MSALLLLLLFEEEEAVEEGGAGAAGASSEAEEATTGVAVEGLCCLEFSLTTLSLSSASAPISFWNPTLPITSIDSRKSRSSTLKARSGP